MARILLADEDLLFRSALAVVLEDEGHEVVAQAGSVEDARPHVAGADLVIASSSLVVGGRLLARLAARPGPRLLVLSATRDHERLLEALEAGAQGYLGKDGALPDLLEGIATVLRGEAFVPPVMLGGLLHELVQRRRTDAGPGPLSRREREVLELLAQGHGQAEIARTLVISPQTARTHIQKVIGKMGAHSRGEAVALAVQHGLVAAS